MRWRTAIIAALAPLLVSATAPREWVVRGDGAVSGSINGIPARLMIDPGATAMPMITSTIARRAGLKPSFFDFEYQVGPQRVIGESAVGRIDVGAGPDKRRIGWANRPWRAGS